MDPSASQDHEAEAPRPPREPPRHSLSNNWRTKGPATPSSETKNVSRGTRDAFSPSATGNRFAGDWRSGSGSGSGSRQDETTTSPVSSARGGASHWRGRDSHRQQDGYARWKGSNDRATSGEQTSSSGPAASSSRTIVEESNALREGRRIYLGNILYHVRPEQITEALHAQGFSEDDVDQIHISVDPVTGRNPGYCFVEFESKETADAALERMMGFEILGRPLKTGPCKPKAWQSQGKQARQYRPTFERWGNWNGDGVQLSGQGPVGAEEHLIEVIQKEQRYRVFVGGLGKMINQAENDKELRAIFEGFRVAAVSKRITPSEVTRAKPGKHHYAFVDLVDEEEAMKAIQALDGILWNGSRLKVRVPVDLPEKIAQRGTRWGTASKDASNETT